MVVGKVLRKLQSIVVVLNDVSHALCSEFFVAAPVSHIALRCNAGHVFVEAIAVELHCHLSFFVHDELETC